MDHQTVRTIVVAVATCVVGPVGVTLIKDRYFAAAFAVLCLLVAQPVGGAA